MQGLGAAEHFAELVLQDLGVEQLLGVFPLIERLGLVQPFVALQADHLQPTPRRDRLRQLGLADARWSFDQDRLLDLLRQIGRGRDLPACDIALRGKAAFYRLDGGRGPDISHECELRVAWASACSARVPGKEQDKFGQRRPPVPAFSAKRNTRAGAATKVPIWLRETRPVS